MFDSTIRKQSCSCCHTSSTSYMPLRSPLLSVCITTARTRCTRPYLYYLGIMPRTGRQSRASTNSVIASHQARQTSQRSSPYDSPIPFSENLHLRPSITSTSLLLMLWTYLKTPTKCRVTQQTSCSHVFRSRVFQDKPPRRALHPHPNPLVPEWELSFDDAVCQTEWPVVTAFHEQPP